MTRLPIHAVRLACAAALLASAACTSPEEFRLVARDITIDDADAALPARWDGELIRVDAVLGAGKPAVLLLDTGASAFILSPGAAQRAGLRIRDDESAEGGVAVTDAHGRHVLARQLARIDVLRCGPLTVRGVDALIQDLSAFEQIAGTPIDGILPATAFLDHLLTIDWAARCVDVRPQGPQPLAGGDVLELADAGVPLARLRVGGRDVPLLFDTGDRGFLSVPAAIAPALRTAGAPVETGRARDLTGLLAVREVRLAEDLGLAGHVLRAPVVELSSAERAAAGLRLLRAFRLTLDLAGRRLRLERAGDAPVECPPVRSIGAGFLRHGATWEVAYVLDSGAAARAGVRPGDVVSAIDGRPVAAIGAERAESLLAGKREVVLRLESGGAPRDVTVAVETLVE